MKSNWVGCASGVPELDIVARCKFGKGGAGEEGSVKGQVSDNASKCTQDLGFSVESELHDRAMSSAIC